MPNRLRILTDMNPNNWKVTSDDLQSRDFATKAEAIAFARLTQSQGWSSKVIDIAGAGSLPGRVVWESLDEAEHHGHLAAERPDRSNQLNYAGGGYATDSRGNYREAFWAGTP